MAKNVLKEIIIILLLTLAIILILGVLLYDYVPMNKVVPETITYTASEETKKALEEKAEIEQDEVILTYEVTSRDLNNYKQTSDYKAGRKNPFSDVISSSTSSENATTQNSSGSTGTSSEDSSSKDTESDTKTENETKKNTNTNTTKDIETENNSSSDDNTSTNYYPDKGIK